MRARRVGVRIGLAVALGALGMAVGGPPADAQDGEATITVEQAHPAGTAVHYIIRITSADDEALNGVIVTATPTGPDGTTGNPVGLIAADDDGRYEGAVDMPADGSWTVAFVSTNPAGTLEYSQEMPAGPVSATSGSSEDSTPIVPFVIAGVFVGLLAALGIWTLLDRRRVAAVHSED